jgi:hypothetical protein
LTGKLACQSELALTPAIYMAVLITFHMILRLAPVPCFFPVKETAKARPQVPLTFSDSSEDLAFTRELIVKKLTTR